MLQFLKDFKGQLSWGRLISLVALVIAGVGSFKGMNQATITLWLGLVLGGYGTSKATEILKKGSE